MSIRLAPFQSLNIHPSNESSRSTKIALAAITSYIASEGAFDDLVFDKDGDKIVVIRPPSTSFYWDNSIIDDILNDQRETVIYSNEVEGHLDFWGGDRVIDKLKSRLSPDDNRKIIIIAGSEHEIVHSKNIVSIGFNTWDYNIWSLWTNNCWNNLLNHTSVNDAIYDLVIPVGSPRTHRGLFLRKLNQVKGDMTIVTDDTQQTLETDLRFSNLGIEVYLNKVGASKFSDHTFYPNFFDFGSSALDHLPHSKMHGIARVNVVLETTYANKPYVFYTEKTVKVLANKRPFVILGDCGLLKYLKSEGFKTFNEYCDESYDDEPNLEKKVSKIIVALKQLNTACKSHPYEIDTICNHNHRKFFELERQTNNLARYGEKLFRHLYPDVRL